ncbi:MAG: ABC transporter ATP-binding protein [Aquihabitans sp.]
MSALIELEQVTVTVGAPSPATILGPITLQVRAGESVAVVGPSGSGKSTLVSVLGGMLPPSAGSYRFDGAELPNSPGALARFRASRVGFVFQAAHLLEDRSAIENVELALTAPARRAVASDGPRQALAAAGVAHLAHRSARVLSGGERQRVALARAVVARPPLVIADEPTGALDRANGERVLDLLMEVPRSGASLVLVTHDPEAAARADRSIRIVDGQIA